MTVNLCVVSGTLLAPDGSPLPDVQVQFLPAPVAVRSQGIDTLAPRPVVVTTDAAARLSVGLAPGVYSVRSREPGGRDYPPYLVDVPARELAELAEIMVHLPAPQSVYDAAASARAAENAASAALESAGIAAARAEQVLGAGGRIYSSRTAFAEEDHPEALESWGVLHAGRALTYRRDPEGTALIAADGVRGTPTGPATVLHWGAGPDQSAATNRAAFLAALAAADTVFVPNIGVYDLGNEPLVINAPGKALIGERRGSGTRLSFGGAGATTGIRFVPADPDSGRLTGCRLQNIDIVGPGSVGGDGYAIEAIQTEGLVVEDVSFLNFARGILVQGGQSNAFRHIRGFAVTGSPVGNVAGRSLFHVRAHTRAADSTIPSYVVSLTDFEFGGGVPHYNVEDVFRIEGVDGLTISNGYVNGGRTGIFHFNLAENSQAGAIVAAQIAGVYADCMMGQTPHAVRFSRADDVSIASVNGLSFSNCFLGVAGAAAIKSAGGGVHVVSFDGCQIRAAAGGRPLDYVGSTSALLNLSNCTLRGGVGSVIGDLAALSLNGGAVMNAVTNPGLVLSGSIGRASVSGLGFHNNAAGDFVDQATVSVRAYGENAGDMSGARDRGTFVPQLLFGGNVSDAAYSGRHGDYTIVKNMVFFRMRVALTSRGIIGGEMRLRIPRVDEQGQLIPLPLGIGPSNAVGSCSVRTHNMSSANVGTGVGLHGDMITAGGAGLDIRLSVFNQWGQAVPLTRNDLTNTSLLTLSGFWVTS